MEDVREATISVVGDRRMPALGEYGEFKFRSFIQNENLQGTSNIVTAIYDQD